MKLLKIIMFLSVVILMTGVSQPLTADARVTVKKKGAAENKAKLRPIVSVKNTFGAIGDIVSITAKMTDYNRQPLQHRSLNFHVDGKYLGFINTNAKGESTIVYKVPNKMVKQPIKVIFKGDSVYPPAEGTAILSPIKSSTKIKMSHPKTNIKYSAGRPILIIGELTRITDGKAVDGREIKIKEGHKTVASTGTNPAGSFNYSYTIPASFIGTKKFTIQFEGDDLYVPTTQTISFTTKGPPQKAYFILNDITGMVGQDVNTVVNFCKTKTFLPANGIKGRKIFLLIGNKILGSAVTNSNGIALINFKINEKAKTYHLNARVDDPHQEFKVHKDPLVNKLLTVKKSPVSIEVNTGVKEVKIGDRILVSAIVHRNSDGNGAENTIVRLQGLYPKTTSSVGSASFFLTISSNMGMGQQLIYVTSEKNERYLEGRGEKSINILPKTD